MLKTYRASHGGGVGMCSTQNYWGNFPADGAIMWLITSTNASVEIKYDA